MRLFLPDARALNWLLIVGFLSLGYALYIRYGAIEQSAVGLACAAGLDTWLCLARSVAIALSGHSVFGCGALILSLLNLLRPSLVLFGAALAFTCMGVVLYNVALASFAAGI